MTDEGPTRLLGHLATTALRGHLEVTATTSLTWLLEQSPELENRTIALLRGIDISLRNDLDWFAEEQLEDRSRPDVEGRLPGTAEAVVRIEAKFTAALTPEQLASYTPVPVVVLHPAYRGREVEDVIGAAALLVPGARFASMTWDDLFDALTVDLPDGVDRENVEQLRALADTATGLDVRPFGADASVESIADRKEDLSTLAVRASAIRDARDARLPRVTRDRWFDVARYFRTDQSWWGVLGLRRSWQELDPATPFWIRIHSDTSGFAQVRAAWEASEQKSGGRVEGGHLFFPLTLPLDVPGAGIERSLRGQVGEVIGGLAAAAALISGVDEPTGENEAPVDGRDELYRSLADEASRIVNPFGRLWPLGADADYEWRRYLPGGTSGTNAAVGLRRGWSERPDTVALWLRFHQTTVGFDDVVSRWSAAGRPDDGVLDRHLFFPLEVDLAALDAADQLKSRRDELLARYAV